MRKPSRLIRAAVAAVAVLAASGGMGIASAPAAASGDPLSARQWALGRINAEAAWNTTVGEGVRIGVVDTGVDLAHEDLAGKVVASTSCIGAGGDSGRCGGSAQDDNGHGTHVAGIAAAWAGNGKGIASVAPGAQLVIAKALDASGSGTGDDVVAAIKWVVDHGARVVNLSLGDGALALTSMIDEITGGIEYAWSRGAVPVLAAGNAALLDLGAEPSRLADLHAVVVGATGPDDALADYSEPTGDAQWALLAPGGSGEGGVEEDVLSTYWEEDETDRYEALAGTSMAAPHVAGALALLLAGGLDPSAAVDRLLATADREVSCGEDSPTCAGRVDVARAVGALP